MSALKLVIVLAVLSLFSTQCSAETRLSVEEVIARVNRLPNALQNVMARRTNDVQLFRQIATTGNSSRIVGGVETTIEESPYQVALLYLKVHVCGGSIIADSWVLTAAHCLDWEPHNVDISFRSGSSTRSGGGSTHPIYYYHLHEQYSAQDYPYDVATVRVRVPFSGQARAIIPLAGAEWTTGSNATVTGWGRTEQAKVSEQLLKVELSIVDRATCNTHWDGLITDDMLCAGDMGHDSCDGDSGGPAVLNGVQYGIVSWGATVCGSGLPGIFTSVAHPSIRSFIKRTTMV